MTLLQQIQNDAVNGTTEISSILRKCRILAQRLKNEEFKQWVNYELDGYPTRQSLPDYRQTNCQSLGHFSGYFGRSLNNAPIPMTCIPKDFREHLTNAYFFEGVSSLQNLVCIPETETLQENWPAELYPLLGGRIYENMNLMLAWKIIPKSTIVGILDTVRNRILNFVLEIESQNPDAGEAIPSDMPIPSDKVQQIFHTHIAGDVGNVATGSHSFSQTATFQIAKGDLGTLEKAVRSLGAQEEDINELKAAIDSEPSVSKGNYGSRVSTWIGKMISKSAQGMLKVGTSAATSFLTDALKQYYGI